MSDLRALYRDASHYLTGQVAGLALGLISFPILTRALSVAEYGMLCLALQVAAMATVLSKMGLQNSIQRYYHHHAASVDHGAIGKFYSTILFAGVLCTTTVVILFVIGLQLVPESFVSPLLKRVLLFGSGLIFARAMQAIVMNFLRAERRTRAFNVFDILARGTSIGVVVALLFLWRRNAQTVLIGTAAVEITGVVLLIIVLLPRGVLSVRAFDQKVLRAALVFGFPLVGYELAGLILDSGDRILVQYYLGFQAVGYYSAGYNMSNYIVTSLTYPVNLALFPIYMKLWVSHGPQETSAFLSTALDKFVIVAMCVLAAVAATARYVVIVLGSRKLQQAYPLLPFLVLGLILYSLHIFFSAGLIIHKKTCAMAKIIASAAALNIALNLLLLPRIGVQGAAVATLLSYAVFLALIVRESFAVLPLRVDVVALSRYMVAAAISVFVATRFSYPSDFLNLFVRGSASVVIYVGVLWGIDRRFRLLLMGAFCYVRRFFGEPNRGSVLTTASEVEARSNVCRPERI